MTLRVLLVMTARVVGGAEHYAAQLVEALDGPCRFTVAAADDPALDGLLARIAARGKVVRLPFGRARRLPGCVRALRGLASGHDVVHVNSNHPGSRLGILMGFGLPGSGAPVICVEHGATAISSIVVPRSIAWALPALFRWSRRGAARVVAVSQENRETLIRLYGLPPARIALVHNGVDLRRFAAAEKSDMLRQELGLGAEHRIILTVGRLARNKGYPYLLQAAPAILARFPTAHFVFAGDPDDRVAAEWQIAGLGLGGHVHILGFRPDVADLLRSSDLFVLPSLAEGFSLALVEALAAGLPVAATRVGGAAEVIEEGRDGFLAPPGDAAALAEAVLRALSLDAAGRAALRRAALDQARAFSFDVTAQKMLALYREVL